jgi:hypothetical protein
MNSVYRTGHSSVLLAAITSTITAAIFVCVLLCAASARGGVPGDGSIVKALVRPGSSNDVSSAGNSVVSASGTVLVEKKGNTQSFIVKAKNIPIPADGLGVFLGDSPTATNGVVFVNVLSVSGSNNTWNLVLENKDGGAPPFLGVTDVNQLVGKFVFVADIATNVSLSTMITPLVPKPSALSYQNRSNLVRSDPSPSPKASGSIRVKYRGQNGASVLKVSGRGLAAGNTYCVIYTASDTPESIECSGGDNLTQGRGSVEHDTGKGADLPFGIDYGVTTVADLAGLNVFVVDAFGAVHLSGTIPGPK